MSESYVVIAGLRGSFRVHENTVGPIETARCVSLRSSALNKFDRAQYATERSETTQLTDTSFNHPVNAAAGSNAAVRTQGVA